MYNRYIRNDQGTYTRIPEEEPRHTQGGTSPSGQPEHPPSGGGQQPPHWDSAPPPRPDPPPSGENGPDSLSSLLRHEQCGFRGPAAVGHPLLPLPGGRG